MGYPLVALVRIDRPADVMGMQEEVTLSEVI